jgi:4-hydroxy-tetrahydrodipicolinate synthase
MSKIGVLAATVTPFKEGSLALDENAYANLVERLLKSDAVGGLVPNAHAGEGATLTREERIQCITIINQFNTTKKRIVACIDSEDLNIAVMQAQDAKRLGCGAVMVCPPPVYAWSPDASPEIAVEYHKRITLEADIPLFLFVYPDGNPLSYSEATIVKLLNEVPNIKAVKLTYKNIIAYQKTYKAIKAFNPEIAVLPTSPAMIFPVECLKAADGMLAGGGNFVAKELNDIITLCENGEYDKAREIHNRLLPLASALLARPAAYLHSRYKYVAYLTGMIPNPLVRPPQLAVSEEDKRLLHETAKTAGLITD